MAFYENTIIARQDLAQKELVDILKKYTDLINNSSGKVIKQKNGVFKILPFKLKTTKKVFIFIISLRVIVRHLLK